MGRQRQTRGMTDANVESPADRYRRLAATFTGTVDAVPADAWENPSPCEGWSAREVLDHVLTSEAGLLSRAGLELQPGPPVDQDPARAWVHLRDAVQAILDDPAQAGTEYEGMGGPTTVGATFGAFMAVDLVVHRWDIAHATAVDESIPEADIAFVRTFAGKMGDMMRTSGAFGPELPAPDGADERTRLLAFLGRRTA